MAGLVPAISVVPGGGDARDKPGHDGEICRVDRIRRPCRDGTMLTFGIFDHCGDNGLPATQQLEERLRLIALMDAEGFHAYHLAEHHGTPLGIIPSPSVFLAAAAQRTRRIRLGPLVYVLPLHHPLRLYEEICLLD